VIINFQAELKGSHIVRLEKDYYSPEEMADIIAQAIQACMWEANFSKDQIAGVGVGIPGPVDSSSGIIRFLPNYGWEEVPFRELLLDKIKHPVFIDNSSNNLAIAEHWFGNGKGVDNFLVITLENGVGAGIVVNGQLVRGHRGIASEFGHTCVDPDGPLCRCGRRGCIEAFAGNNAIVAGARESARRGGWRSSEKVPDELDYSDVIAELAYDNSELKSLYKKAGEVLGRGVYNLITLLDPERVIITGKGLQAGDALLKDMFAEIDRLKRAKIDFAKTDIVIQTWTDGDWARESGTLVLREIYKSPFFK
jgi:predicted NBD/HSP70 family sugar kinase